MTNIKIELTKTLNKTISTKKSKILHNIMKAIGDIKVSEDQTITVKLDKKTFEKVHIENGSDPNIPNIISRVESGFFGYDPNGWTPYQSPIKHCIITTDK